MSSCGWNVVSGEIGKETCHWPLLRTNGEGPAPGVRVLARSTEPGNCFPPRPKPSAATHACLFLDAVGHGWVQNLGGLHVPSPPTWGFEFQFDEVPSATSCSFHMRSAFTSAQSHSDEVCHIRVVFPDHLRSRPSWTSTQLELL